MWVRKLIRAIGANGYSGRNFLVIPTQIGPALCWSDDETLSRMRDEQAL
ncbi:hypothetical protein DO65_5850 [Burkholderia pseudomallei]|nr:hypothetical protein DO65_5850 [Burkholderia pseudomallei]KGX67695.1 hypothetical protein Y026_5485 [Burkholderia pseudomallei TSV28]